MSRVLSFLTGLALLCAAWVVPAVPAAAGPFAQYDAAAVVYFNQITTNGCTAPSATFKTAVNTFIITVKAQGNWRPLVGVWQIGGTADECTAKINLRRPGVYGLTFNGSYAWTAATGFAGDGATAYADTGINFSTLESSNQDNMHVGVYTATTSLSVANMMGLSNTGSGIYLTISNQTRSSRLSSATLITEAALTGGRGYHATERTNSATIATWRNGVVLSAAASAASASRQSANIYLCRVNTSYCSSTAYLTFADAGGTLPDPAAYYSAVLALQSALGIAVP